MIISKEVWIAQDSNGDVNCFSEKPHKMYNIGTSNFWTTESGTRTPLRLFSLSCIENKNLQEEPLKAKLTLDI